ncbi:LysR family transcriptional regulator [Klebsiella oxytoca]|uniref:LysR family transcriptional regulator n=1 Tax=Klebsiella oxytoca TaxID=571 RepID=UPI003570C335
MNISQLRCFLILSETLSFAHTAEIINLTQPAITYQIKKLEDSLKFSLFIRGRQGVELTPEGKMLYPYVKEAIAQLQIAIDKASSLHRGIPDVINIGYDGYDLERYNLPVIINAFKEIHPGARILVFKSNHKERRASLLNSKYDIILTVKDNIESSEGVIYKQIISAGLDCVVSTSNKLQQKQVIMPGDLKSQRLILFDPLQVPKELDLIQSKLISTFPKDHFIYADSEHSAAIMIRCNEGVAIMPSFCRQMTEGLTQKPFSLGIELSYGVAYLKNNNKKNVKELAKMIQEEYSGLISAA